MPGLHKDIPARVLVTGSRGKSSVVRMLHAGFSALGVETWARITGVDPRELGPRKTRSILRSAGAHVGEMHWWLKGLPSTAGAVVLENSAVTPDLQELAAEWLDPSLTVFTNAVPDHQEAWGTMPGAAAHALAGGVPRGGTVVLPASMEYERPVLDLLQKRDCRIIPAETGQGADTPHGAANLGLAIEALRLLGMDSLEACRAMRELPPDRYDFRVLEAGGVELAMAFSANDAASTRRLFGSLGWAEADTHLVYNHRADRPARFRSFAAWLAGSGWRGVTVIGDRPPFRPGAARYRRIRRADDFYAMFETGDRVFGCGNIAGLPLLLY